MMMMIVVVVTTTTILVVIIQYVGKKDLPTVLWPLVYQACPTHPTSLDRCCHTKR